MKFRTMKQFKKRDYTTRPCYVSLHLSMSTYQKLEEMAEVNGTSIGYEGANIVESYMENK